MHGRDFKPAAPTWRELALAALKSGFERDMPAQLAAFEAATVDVAWYADLSARALDARGRRYDEALDVGDYRNALAALQRIPARKRFGIRQYDRLPGKSAVAEFAADIGAPVLGALGLWSWLVRRNSPDFADYLFGPGEYRDAVVDRVRRPLADLLSQEGRVALVAHGTGAVVAWDALRACSAQSADCKVDLFVTLGAPLADAHLRRRLLAEDRDGLARFPENVRAWCNVAAEDDYTCHDKTVADDYREMLERRLVASIEDFRIYNHAVRFGRSNPHSSIGYFVHPRVTKILGDWLTLT